MRDTKFRALLEQTGEWFHWGPISFVGPHDIREDIREETVGQYTGLKDRSGVDVFQGDIFTEKNPDGEHQTSGEVIFDGDLAAFTVKKPNGGWEYLHVFLSENRRSFVGGNVHQHPELLTEGK
jgi:hypothetical protein